jgi:hypothetical protein
MTLAIKPTPVIKADRIDNQRIATPTPDRMPLPGWLQVFWMAAPIEQHLAEAVTHLLKDDKQMGCLNDLIEDRRQQRNAHWQTLRRWHVLQIVFNSLPQF